ncbi:MAG: NAD(+) synthase [Sphaerochaetaceae bacterium]|nr:NAD(+) synthase [Sphaerochaetaceae bacterium]
MKDGLIKVATYSPINYTVDIENNTNNIIDAIYEAEKKKVKVITFPELCITSYTAGDLFLNQSLADKSLQMLDKIVISTKKAPQIVSVVGTIFILNNRLYNCAAVIQGGKVLGIVPKQNIPNYQEFYEKRWFSEPKDENVEIELFNQKTYFGTRLLFKCSSINDLVLAVEICEDLWVPNSPSNKHSVAGATIIANPSATDDIVTKSEYRRNLVSIQSAKCICAYLYAGAGEGESTTDLVFNAHNLICENGRVLVDEEEKSGVMNIAIVDVQRLSLDRKKMNTFYSEIDNYKTIYFNLDCEKTSLDGYKISKTPFIPSSKKLMKQRCEKILTLQALGLVRRLKAAHCKSAVIGLSGGLDSTLALLVTIRAFEKANLDVKNIHAISMPCFGTTKRTKTNSEKLAQEMGVSFKEINISKAVRQHFIDIEHDEENHNVVYENSQARERTQILMNLANKYGALVIGTGDLSELALGWATYNGDHMSMYGVNSSVPKTLVKHLVTYSASIHNSNISKILIDIVNTPVSPELLPPSGDGTISQKTEEFVGPYLLHDFFLFYFVRCSFTTSKIRRLAHFAFKDEFTTEIIDKWLEIFIKRFFSQQFKRSTLPDGPKVGSVTLSPRGDWRMPSDAISTVWLD